MWRPCISPRCLRLRCSAGPNKQNYESAERDDFEKMRYFGVPTCPYCKKRVNLVRTWSLKRQGEYQCPRCGGISNIYLSPLIYVLALLAISAGGVIYFFHKFILDDIELKTALYVFIPFVFFFLFSLFMVYLEKPVIKKVSKSEYGRKRRDRSNLEELSPAPANQNFYNDDSYTPRGSNRAGPVLQQNVHQGVVNQEAFSRARQQAELENSQQIQRAHSVSRPANAVQRPQQPAPGRTAPSGSRTQPQAAYAPQRKAASPQQRVSAPSSQQIQRPAPRPVVQQQRPVQRTPSQRPVQVSSQQRMSFAQQGAAVQQQYRPTQGRGQSPHSGLTGMAGDSPRGGYLDQHSDSGSVQRKGNEQSQFFQNSRQR